MKRLICFLRGIIYSIWFMQNVSGHEYEAVGDLPFDRLGYGDLKCKRCGKVSHGW